MSFEDLPPQYDPTSIERDIYERWVAAGVFHPSAERSMRSGGDRTPFTIVMPPPNVTAILHLGQGLNAIVQDTIIRWRRMAGDETLWLPGTDHAGIATQNVVEKQLGKEGRTRFDLGRDALVARVADFVASTGGVILKQLRAIGASADWSRTAYTFSPELSVAVREAFVRLYERGLIYRGHRVIHWCPRCLTSLSDEEAEFKDETGQLYHIAYPIEGERDRALTIATTRPETMLGDVAVAVNPDDDRYRDLVGRRVILPIANISIPIIADAYADPAFGTGVVKITPAHDANDFEVGVRHRLPMPVVISAESRMQEVSDAEGRVPETLRGLDRFDARVAIVQTLSEAGRLVKVETHQHAVRHCYRCDTVVEPRLSDQWFVRMKPLAEPALAGVREGRIRLVPQKWEGVYVNWMENIRDWNISRQIWWGHRVPVWYCDACNEMTASRTDLTTCTKCGGAVRQDEDVLDTWFSSWLWPFSTLGWPRENQPDLKAFYPGDVLVTAPEILFFWVSRMIMAGYFFLGEAPFHTVYLHGTVRDTRHLKMSKSLGNGIDPLDVIALYGTDALRWTLIAGLGVGADVILDPNDLERSFATGRNFSTKLWNIARFLLSNVGSDPVRELAEIDPARLTRADRWILARLDVAIAECDAALGPSRPQDGASAGLDLGRWTEQERNAGMRLNEYAETARRFVWNELADWYLESVKGRLLADSATQGSDREVARAVLVHAFDRALRLLHPIVPFITETLWQRLPSKRDAELLAIASWPRPLVTDASALSHAHGGGGEFELVREAVVAIRQVRADYNIPPGKSVDVLIIPAHSGNGSDSAAIFRDESALIGKLTRATVALADAPPREAAAHIVLTAGTEVCVPLAGLIDVAQECAKLRGEVEQLDKQLGALRQRLSNEKFIGRAPADVVEGERRKEREWSARRDQLANKVTTLCGG